MWSSIGWRYSISLQSYILLVSASLCTITSTFAQVSVNIPTTVEQCWYPCKDDPNKNIPIPGTNCKLFYVCRNGEVTNSLSCESGMSFDKISGQCLNTYLVTCVDPTCEPTLSPSGEPTISPSNSPSRSPTDSPSNEPTQSPTSDNFGLNHILSKQSSIEGNVLVSYTPNGVKYPSRKYHVDKMVDSLQIMANDGFGDDNFKFWLWDSDPSKFRIGLINLAAFLANAMEEAIRNDTCDELNWQQVAGRHSISNSCGQEGRSYQDESCGNPKKSCQVDTSMEIYAVDASTGARSPPPLECRPKTDEYPFSGYWDSNTGKEVTNSPYANSVGRIDIEGCCYWGRGVLLTRGTCNIGKLNYYLGAVAAREGRQSLYPNIDFCRDPEATCSSSLGEEVKWTTAMFEWADRIQRYNKNGWNYETELYKFFDGGMKDDRFVEATNRILARGCHEFECSEFGEPRFADERKANFYMILNDVFTIKDIVMPTNRPTQKPTEKPTSSAPTESNVPSPLVPLQPEISSQTTVCSGLALGIVTINECKEYVECSNGNIVSRQSCSSGLLYDITLKECTWAFQVSCKDDDIINNNPIPTRQPVDTTWFMNDPGEQNNDPSDETLIPLEGNGVQQSGGISHIDSFTLHTALCLLNMI